VKEDGAYYTFMVYEEMSEEKQKNQIKYNYNDLVRAKG